MATILTREEVVATGLLTVHQDKHHNEVVIPDRYDAIGDGAFMYNSNLYKVVIPSTIKTIGKSAFKNCPNLQEVEIHDGVEQIEDYAFWNCLQLKRLILPLTIKKTGNNVFDGKIALRIKPEENSQSSATSTVSQAVCDIQNNITSKKGFAAIAGMQKLKDQLQSDVIDVIREPERAKQLGINLPNGILLYGPPGCGKTYFAEKFAEEAGFNFQIVNCSDIASVYVHGTQEEIAKVFKSAREKAPTILFFDEIEAMIPNRSSSSANSTKTETNEFLTQLNGCGKQRVVVIGATNRPQDIDPAALRAGRLEVKVYLPQPNFETRQAMFALKLLNKNRAGFISTSELARLTENYVSADISMIVDQAARLAFRLKMTAITMELLEKTIKEFKPTVPLSIIQEHERIRDQFENQKTSERTPIGFC